jgi:hypothetical protein
LRRAARSLRRASSTLFGKASKAAFVGTKTVVSSLTGNGRRPAADARNTKVLRSGSEERTRRKLLTCTAVDVDTKEVVGSTDVVGCSVVVVVVGGCVVDVSITVAVDVDVEVEVDVETEVEVDVETEVEVDVEVETEVEVDEELEVKVAAVVACTPVSV